MSQFSYTDQKGKTWYLNLLSVGLRTGAKQELLFFSARPGKGHMSSRTVAKLPEGHAIIERGRGHWPPQIVGSQITLKV